MTEISKLLLEFDNLKLATKEERAIYELLKIVIRQQKEIDQLKQQTRVKW